MLILTLLRLLLNALKISERKSRYNKLRSLIEGATNVKPTQAMIDVENISKRNETERDKANAIKDMIRRSENKNKNKK